MENSRPVIVRPSRLATLCLVLLTLMAIAVFAFWARDRVYSYQHYRLHGTLTTSSWCSTYELRDAPVEVRDASDTMLGYARTVVDNTSPGNCTVHFSAVVSRADMYQMTVGTHPAPVYTFDQMQGMNWRVDLHM